MHVKYTQITVLIIHFCTVLHPINDNQQSNILQYLYQSFFKCTTIFRYVMYQVFAGISNCIKHFQVYQIVSTIFKCIKLYQKSSGAIMYQILQVYQIVSKIFRCIKFFRCIKLYVNSLGKSTCIKLYQKSSVGVSNCINIFQVYHILSNS